MNLEGKWKAVWIGGVITGFASLVPFLNLACCILPFAGAIIAVAIYSNSTSAPAPLSNNDGIVIGAMTGAIATLVYAVVIIPVIYFFGTLAGRLMGPLATANDQAPGVQLFLETLGNHLGAVLAVILLFKIISQLAMSVIFGLLGGLAGAALFRRSNPA